MSETETENKGMFSSLYSGSASLGVFMADLGMVVGLILGVMILLVGFNKTLYEDDMYLNVMGRVSESVCQAQASNIGMGNNSATYYKCNVVVTYDVDGKEYVKPLFVRSAEQYMNNEPISLWVDKSNHENVDLAGYNGSTLMSLSLLIVSIAYFNFYLTHRFKFYAAGRGTSTVFNMFR